MSPKRALWALFTLLCVGAGAVRWLDLAGNTDPASGLAQQGSLLMRYGLMLVPLVVLALAGLLVPRSVAHPMGGAAALPAFCGLLFGGVIGGCLFFLQAGALLQLAAAVLLAVGSLWFAGQAARPGQAAPFTGLAAALGWVAVCAALFGQTASLYHFTQVLELLTALAGALLCVGMARAACSPQACGHSRMLFVRGMWMFYLGTCLLLPQELWQWAHGASPAFMPGKGVAAGLLGLSGWLYALRCMGTQGLPAQQEDEDETADGQPQPAAVPVAAAAQRAAAAPAAPAGAWSKAAAALYGGAPAAGRSAAEAAAPAQKDLFGNDTAPSGATAAAMEAVFPAMAAEPAAPVFTQPAATAQPAAPVFTQPAAATAQPAAPVFTQPAAAKPAAPASPQSAAAKPAAPASPQPAAAKPAASASAQADEMLRQLDRLLGRTPGAGAASGTSSGAASGAPAAQDAPAGGDGQDSRWVFRRD